VLLRVQNRGKYGTRGKKKWCQGALVAYQNGDVVDMGNLGLAKYRFVLWSILRKPMLTLYMYIKYTFFSIKTNNKHIVQFLMKTFLKRKLILYPLRFIFFNSLIFACQLWTVFPYVYEVTNRSSSHRPARFGRWQNRGNNATAQIYAPTTHKSLLHSRHLSVTLIEIAFGTQNGLSQHGCLQ
jgi:hypothetical protein